jgi:hypothetical protein
MAPAAPEVAFVQVFRIAPAASVAGAAWFPTHTPLDLLPLPTAPPIA